MASFAMQYGIRLEKEDLAYSEYRRLLAGVMYNTPLGEIVRIRAETDMKTIRGMAAHEKKIRADWQRFSYTKKAKDNRRAEEQGALAFADFAKRMWGGG